MIKGISEHAAALEDVTNKEVSERPLVNGIISPISLKANGDAHPHPINTEGILEQSASETETETEDTPTTPRIDKGKGRAEPEPEQPEKILSPTPRFVLSSGVSDDEDHDGHMLTSEPEGILDGSLTRTLVPSSMDRSRSWVQEEGEVFRKSNVLLTEEEMEGEYAGDELRIEVSLTFVSCGMI